MTARETRAERIEAALREQRRDDDIGGLPCFCPDPEAVRAGAYHIGRCDAARQALALPPDAPQDAGEFAGHTQGPKWHASQNTHGNAVDGFAVDIGDASGDNCGQAFGTTRMQARERAALIAAAVNERPALLAERDHWKLRHGEAARTVVMFQDEAIALRAEVAELREALRDLLPIAEAFRDAQPSSSVAFAQACEVLAPARAALARGEL